MPGADHARVVDAQLAGQLPGRPAARCNELLEGAGLLDGTQILAEGILDQLQGEAFVGGWGLVIDDGGERCQTGPHGSPPPSLSDHDSIAPRGFIPHDRDGLDLPSGLQRFG